MIENKGKKIFCEDEKIKIIELIKGEVLLNDQDFIEIEQYGGGLDESCLVGTKNGLVYFALNILSASMAENKLSDVEVKCEGESNINLDYIQVVSDEAAKEKYKLTLKDSFIGFFGMLFLLFLVTSCFVGAGTILRYVFSNASSCLK